MAGFSFAGRGQNMALAWVKLKDWNVRKTSDLKAPAIAGASDEGFFADSGRSRICLRAAGGTGAGGGQRL